MDCARTSRNPGNIGSPPGFCHHSWWFSVHLSSFLLLPQYYDPGLSTIKSMLPNQGAGFPNSTDAHHRCSDGPRSAHLADH